jgi:hypothetical protein
MKKNQEPAALFEQITAVENRYNTVSNKVSQEDLIAVILDAAPAEYQAVLTSEQRFRGAALMQSDLEDAMNQHRRQLNKNKGAATDDDKTELTLSAIVCYECNQEGHKASSCPVRQQRTNQGGRGGGRGGRGAGRGGRGAGRGGRGGRFQGNCNHCGKPGHKAANCWEKEENAANRPPNYRPTGGEVNNANVDGGSNVEFLLMAENGLTFPTDQSLLSHPNVWIADTAATVHTTPHKQGSINKRAASREDAITVGNGSSETASEIADIAGVVCDKHGNELHKGVLKDVTLLPTGKFNLFSLSKMLKLGWKMGGDKTAIWIESGDQKISFDIIIPTPNGALFVMYMKRTGEKTKNELAITSIDKMSIQSAHKRLGHCNEDMTRKAVKALGLALSRGSLGPCYACAAGKAKQKNVLKRSEHIPSAENNGRIYLDIATVKRIKDGPKVSKPNWRIMVDECTNLKFSDFYETKAGMVEPTCEQFYRWKQARRPVKFVRLDNAGENKKLKSRAESVDWKFDTKFEFTVRVTPQQNHYAELGLTVIANRGRAVMLRMWTFLALSDCCYPLSSLLILLSCDAKEVCIRVS